MNNIQRVIEESNKVFDEKFTSVWSSKHGELIRIPDGIKGSIKSHISETIRQVLQAVEEEVEKLDPPPCDCTGAKFECEHWGRHETVSDIQSLLKSTKENIK